jgi:hypothetical protein
MPIKLVQQQTYSVAAQSFALDLSGVTPGNLLVACIAVFDGSGTYTVSDDQNNAWAPVDQSGAATAGGNYRVLTWYARDVLAGNPLAVTFSTSLVGGDFWGLCLMEFSGADPGDPLDQHAVVADGGVGGTTTTPATPSVTTLRNGELYVGVCCMGGPPTSYTAESGWTDNAQGGYNHADDSIVNVDVEVYGHRSIVPAGSYQASWTVGAAHYKACALLTFKAAAAAPAPPYPEHATCDIYRAGRAPPSNPDISGVPILLQPQFPAAHSSATVASQTAVRWTHVAYMPLGTDIRDGYQQTSAVGEEGASAVQDAVYVPDKSGTKFLVVFVARMGYGSASDLKQVYLQRLPPSWPTNSL